MLAGDYGALESYEQAVAASRRVISISPGYSPHANYWMGRLLMRKQDWEGAIPALREAVRLLPTSVLKTSLPAAHQDLGRALGAAGRHDEAIPVFREAIRLEPDVAETYVYLGMSLRAAGRHDEAIAAYREAIRLKPDQAAAYRYLGMALKAVGRHAEALQVMLDAMHQNPVWAEDPRTTLRYNAACYTICCADGKGVNAPPPAERPAYRKRAFDLLTAELAAIQKLAAAERTFVYRTMQHWLVDEDLATVRLPGAVGQLPPDQRDAWQKLWADVRDLRDRTAPQTDSPGSVK